MAHGGIHTRRKPAVVQLTALLDLLFIMIFIGLLTPGQGDADTESTEAAEQSQAPKSETEKSKAREQLLAEVSAESQAAVEGLGPELKKMFMANVYYTDSRGRREYGETALWSADADFGLLRFRLKLSDGTAIVRTNVSEPLVMTDEEPVSDCDRINLTAERIYQHCTSPFGRTTTIDCERSGNDAYHCSESLSQTHQGRTSAWRWDYDLELISVYDSRFAD